MKTEQENKLPESGEILQASPSCSLAGSGFSVGESGVTVEQVPGDISYSTVYHSQPELISTFVKKDSIELIYKQEVEPIFATFLKMNMNPIVYKVIYSCKNGKWHESERIYGEIIPATEEYYEFNE